MSATIRIKRSRDEHAPTQLMVEKRLKEDIEQLSNMVKDLGKKGAHIFSLAASTETSNISDIAKKKNKRKSRGAYSQIKRWKEDGRSFLELETTTAAAMSPKDVVIDTYHYQRGKSLDEKSQSLFADTGILAEQIEVFQVNWDIEDFIQDEEKNIKKVTFADEEQDSESEANSRNDYPDELTDSEVVDEQESEDQEGELYSVGSRNKSLRGESDLIAEDDYVPFSYGAEPQRDTDFDEGDIDFGSNYFDEDFDCNGISHFGDAPAPIPNSNTPGEGAAYLRDLVKRYSDFAIDDDDIFSDSDSNSNSNDMNIDDDY